MAEEMPGPRRVIIERAFLELQVNLLQTGQDPELAKVIMAIDMGEQEGRPMDVSAVSTSTGLTRSTTIRYLNALERLGIVSRVKKGRRTLLKVRFGDVENTLRFLRAAERTIRKAIRDLSK
ncbi:MAG: helix-turn-helix domain-containing protein, partial [Pararhizobium sp.]